MEIKREICHLHGIRLSPHHFSRTIESTGKHSPRGNNIKRRRGMQLQAVGLISLSAGLPSLHPPDCEQIKNIDGSCIGPSLSQSIFFYSSLYLLALGHGGLRPSSQAFGTDQFDVMDPQESRSRSSFYNWLFVGSTAGSIVGITMISYLQEQVGWAVGFGSTCFAMVFALAIFILGRRSYRFGLKRELHPLTGLLKGLFVLLRKSSSSKSGESNLLFSGVDETALLQSGTTKTSSVKDKQVELAKAVLKLLPIWAISLIYPLVTSQRTTFFIKQRTNMDRRMFSDNQIPSATIQCLVGLTTFIQITIYDRICVPAMRRFTGIANGITTLQRIGTGIFFCIIGMAVAGLVEMSRLRIAREAGLIDLPMVMVPMSAWWSVPQLLLVDFGDVFALVGFLEFFYEQVPDGLQSIGISLSFGMSGAGSLLSGFLIFVVDKLSLDITGESWLSDNINRAHLDYFFLLLAGLSILELGVFLILARRYVYKNRSA